MSLTKMREIKKELVEKEALTLHSKTWILLNIGFIKTLFNF